MILINKDITGMQYGNLIVIKDSGKRSGDKSILWECECQCKDKNIILLTYASLNRRKNLTCGCQKLKMKPVRHKDLTGMTFGRWKVIEYAGLSKAKSAHAIWLVECSCENKTRKIIQSNHLISGESVSCGCLEIEKRRNTYNLSGEYGIGWTSNTNKEFYFDLEDYEKIKDYRWAENNTGYLITQIGRKGLLFHRLILDLKDSNIHVDHIYHNKLDNRKEFLRIVTNQQNCFNKKIKGVYWDTAKQRWTACLTYNKRRYSKVFINYDDAVEYRRYLEDKYFKDFAYQEPPESYIAELNELSKVN